MAIKIELKTDVKLPRHFHKQISNILEILPREHLRGIERIRVVESITDPRVRASQQTSLPGLYHPKQGSQPAWIEIAINPLLFLNQKFYKRLMYRLSFKSNIAAVTVSLVGQHYYLTLRHSMKRGQIEPAVRAYTERYLKIWGYQQHTWRSRIFKPLQPTFERWAKYLQRQTSENRKKIQSRNI